MKPKLRNSFSKSFVKKFDQMIKQKPSASLKETIQYFTQDAGNTRRVRN